MDKKFKHRNGLGTGTGDSDVTSGESGVSHVPRQPPSTPSDLNVVKAAPAQRRGVSKASVPKKVSALSKQSAPRNNVTKPVPNLAIAAGFATIGAAPVGQRKAPVKTFSTLKVKEKDVDMLQTSSSTTLTSCALDSNDQSSVSSTSSWYPESSDTSGISDNDTADNGVVATFSQLKPSVLGDTSISISDCINAEMAKLGLLPLSNAGGDADRSELHTPTNTVEEKDGGVDSEHGASTPLQSPSREMVMVAEDPLKITGQHVVLMEELLHSPSRKSRSTPRHPSSRSKVVKSEKIEHDSHVDTSIQKPGKNLTDMRKEWEKMKAALQDIQPLEQVRVRGRHIPVVAARQRSAAVRKIQPKAKHVQDENSIHYFCHHRQLSGRLAFPVLVASLLSHPSEPEVKWHLSHAPGVSRSTSEQKVKQEQTKVNIGTKKSILKAADAADGKLSKEESDALFKPLFDRIEKEVAADQVWMPFSSTDADTVSDDFKPDDVKTGEVGRNDETVLAPSVKPWTASKEPKRVTRKAMPLRLAIEPNVVQTKMCQVYDHLYSQQLVKKAIRDRQKRREADALSRSQGEKTNCRVSHEVVDFRERLHRRRSVSICGRALTYFSTRQIPDEVDDGDFYGGSDTDELGPGFAHMRTCYASEFDHRAVQHGGMQHAVRVSTPWRRWKSRPLLSSGNSSSLVLDSSYDACIAEVLRLQVSLERAQSAAVHDALDAGYVNATSTYSVQTDGDDRSFYLSSASRKLTQSQALVRVLQPLQQLNQSLQSDTVSGGSSTRMKYAVDELKRPVQETLLRRKSCHAAISPVKVVAAKKEAKEMATSVGKRDKREQGARRQQRPRIARKTQPRLRLPGRQAILNMPGSKPLHSLRRSISVPLALPVFADLIALSKPMNAVDEYDWAISRWSKWFDEYSASLDRDSEDDAEDSGGFGLNFLRKSSRLLASQEFDELLLVEPVIDDETTLSVAKAEIQRLTSLIHDDQSGDVVKACALCRRGALNIKVGQLVDAFSDVNKSLALNSDLLDGYWYRYFLWMIQKRELEAFTDLQHMINCNEKCVKALQAKAEMLLNEGKPQDSIATYSTAIRHDPENAGLYLRRAELYEEMNDDVLAMLDYGRVNKLQPSNSVALWRLGLYNFQSRYYKRCVDNFSQLIAITDDAHAYLYRGMSYARIAQHASAVQDLSATIIQDPSCTVAFYERGRILMKAKFRRALQDLSTALLIGSDDQRLLADTYLHRGVLYAKKSRYSEAVGDFKSALAVCPEMSSAYVSLATIAMDVYGNYRRAKTHLDAAIACDQSCDRAYALRADCYKAMNQPALAVNDYSKAIRIKPNLPQYWLFRGRLHLASGNQRSATSDIRCAAVQVARGDAPPIPRAIVQLFLGETEESITNLTRSAKNTDNPNVVLELGKAHMAAGQFATARQCFNKALAIQGLHSASVVLKRCKKVGTKKGWSAAEASNCYYLIGKCYLESQEKEMAMSSFSMSLKLDQLNAKAYYEKALLLLPHAPDRAMRDLNQTLGLDRMMYEVYLTRAAHCSLTGAISQATVNCNNAIKMRSIRGYLYRGMINFQKGLFDEAVSDLSGALELDPNCVLALYNRAKIHNSMGNFNKALVDYSIILLLHDIPDSGYSDVVVTTYLNRGLLYYKLGQFDQALRDFERLREHDSEDAHLYHCVGAFAMRLGYLEEGVHIFSSILADNPHAVEAYNARAACFWEFCHPVADEMAMRDYSRAIMQDPLHTTSHVNLGLCLQMTGRYKEAWYRFTVAVNINPECTRAREARGVLNLQMREFDAATQDFNHALRVSRTSKLLTGRAVVSIYKGDSRLAMTDLDEAMSLDTNCYLAFFNAGCIAARQRHYAKALKCFDRASELMPNDYSLRNNHGVLLALTKDLQSADAEMEFAAGYVYLNRANVLKKMGNTLAAMEAYSQAIAADPECQAAFRLRGLCNELLGNNEDAVSDFRRVLELESRTS